MSLRDSYDEELLQTDDDEDMESLLARVRRKKPRLKYPGRDDRELTSERTERTPLIKGKTSLRPRQRSRSKSLSPTITEKKMELGRTASNDFYTPKRQSLSLAGHSRSGEISVPNSSRQHRASGSGPSPKAPLKEPSLPSTSSAGESDPLSLASRDHSKPPRPLEDDNSEYSSDEEEGASGKRTDSEEKNELSQALKDMTSVLNVLVKRVENNSNKIHALKTTLQNNNTPSSSSESSSGSRK